jgi:His/Glu/Gln/Arg/opine family amino acid ABC transporter permease subunit
VDVITNNLHFFVQGAWVTIYVSVAVVALGTLIGVLLGVIASVAGRPARFAIASYVFVMRGVPALVTLFLIYYLLPAYGIHVPPLLAGVTALSLYGGAFITEIVRAAIITLPRGQTEAAKALGMTTPQAMRHVILPQATRFALPSYVTMVGRLIRTTSILYIIHVPDLTLVAKQIMARDLMPFHILGTTMVIYFALTYPLSVIGLRLERRLAQR